MRFVVELRPVVADDGSTATYLFADDAWCTLPTDTPPNTRVRGLLKNPGTLRRELFSGQRVTGAITPSWGNIVLANPAPDKDGAGDLDDWIDYGLSGAEVIVRRGRVGDAYPADYHTVYIAKCHSFVADSGEITIRLRDDLQLLDSPIVTEGFAGTGGLEGNGSVAKRKQFVSGDPGLIEPILIDPVRLIYYVQSTSTGGLHDYWQIDSAPEVRPFDVFINGVRVTRSTTNYTSEADIIANAPAAGYVKFYFGPDCALASGWKNGGVYFRLTGSVSGDVRVYAQGYTTDGDIANMAGSAGNITAAHLALRAGVPLGNIDTATSSLAVRALWVDDDRTYLDVLADQGLAQQGWYGFDRLGRFRAGYLLDPASTSAYYGCTPGLISPEPAADSVSVYTFTERMMISPLRREPPSGMDVPAWTVAATAGDTAPSQVAGGASNTLRDYCTRKVWASFSGSAPATKLRDPGATSSTVKMRGRLIQSSRDQRLWLERWLALFAGRRHFYSFTVAMSEAVLALDLHDCVTLQHRRFGLEAGVKARIVGMTIDCAAKVPSVRFVLWAGTPGRYTSGSSSTTPGGGSGGGSFVPPTIALAALGEFTGFIFGSVETSGGAASGASAALMGDFAGLLTGSAADWTTKLLFRGDDLRDGSYYGRALTASGSPAVVSDAGAVGGYALDFNGASLFSTPAAPGLTIGGGAFCIEARVKLDTSGSHPLVGNIGSTWGLDYEWSVIVQPDWVLFYYGRRGTNQFNLRLYWPTALTLSAWHHVAIQRDASGNWYCWLDGVPGTQYQVAPLAAAISYGSIVTGTYANSIDVGEIANDVTVGGSAVTGLYVDGRINELRMSRVERYSGTFTPTTSPFTLD